MSEALAVSSAKIISKSIYFQVFLEIVSLDNIVKDHTILSQ